MTFKFVSPQAIKSDSQRALAFYWDQLAAGRRFPAFGELKPDPALHDPKQLVVWNIEDTGRLRKFRALYQGENVAEVFNSTWAGKTMEQVVPMSLRRWTLKAAGECAASGCLVYTIISTIDSSDRRINCERLLLPFGNDGSKVEQILASLQLTSIVGSARRDNILSHFQIQTDELFSGKIKSGFAAVSERAASAAAGEKRRASRRDVRRSARISFAKKSMTCIVRNISATGASIEAANLAELPDKFKLVMEMESAVRPCTVVWRKKAQIGIHFG